jgi:hypothetical protein
MSRSNVATLPPADLTASKDAFARAVPPLDPVGLERKIRERAHELYEIRGRGPGKDEQDWLQAEHEILDQLLLDA